MAAGAVSQHVASQYNVLLPTRVSPSRSEHDLCVLLQTLVHVLAALALMGLGCLWLLMNLSAEFAHAKRDMRELPGRSPTTLTQVGSGRGRLQQPDLPRGTICQGMRCRHCCRVHAGAYQCCSELGLGRCLQDHVDIPQAAVGVALADLVTPACC